MLGKTLPRQRDVHVEPTLLLQFFVPFETVFDYVGSFVSNSGKRVADWFHMEDELSALRDENKELRLRQLALEEIREENIRLRRLLNFKQTRDDMDDAFAARVIGRNPSQWFASVVINRGRDDGVKTGMVVINSYGLVGKIVSVSKNSAVVRLLTDPNSGVGVTVQRSRDQGVITGQLADNQTLLIRFFSREADIQPGDVVVSSGRLSRQFPDGIPIGTVAAVSDAQYGLLKQAIVHPFVDFNRLEEVLIIPFQPDYDDEAAS